MVVRRMHGRRPPPKQLRHRAPGCTSVNRGSITDCAARILLVLVGIAVMLIAPLLPQSCFDKPVGVGGPAR